MANVALFKYSASNLAFLMSNKAIFAFCILKSLSADKGRSIITGLLTASPLFTWIYLKSSFVMLNFLQS